MTTDPTTMSGMPTEKELADFLSRAKEAPGQTVSAVWHNGVEPRCLSVTFVRRETKATVLWVLRKGVHPGAATIWTRIGSTAASIHPLLILDVTPSSAVPDERAQLEADRRTTTWGSGSQNQILEPGAVFENHKIIALIGCGGMGAVYKAVEPINQTYVALKVLPAEHIDNNELRLRFLQEGTTCCAIQHPNIVRAFEFGISSNNEPYMVMELVEGASLRDWLDEAGTLDLSLFVSIFLQCCEGMSVPHRMGIVHRDLQPENIKLFQEDDGTLKVKILDFGLAKIVFPDWSDQEISRIGQVLGTPLYMSPEQFMARKVDARSDIYSLGCVMYESLTGVLPFLGDTARDVMYKQTRDDPPPLSQVNPQAKIPAEVERIIRKALAKNVSQRYQSLDELASDLRAFAETR